MTDDRNLASEAGLFLGQLGHDHIHLMCDSFKDSWSESWVEVPQHVRHSVVKHIFSVLGTRRDRDSFKSLAKSTRRLNFALPIDNVSHNLVCAIEVAIFVLRTLSDFLEASMESFLLKDLRFEIRADAVHH